MLKKLEAFCTNMEQTFREAAPMNLIDISIIIYGLSTVNNSRIDHCVMQFSIT